MKEKIIGVFITIFLCVLLFFVGLDSRTVGDPYEVYQVYLNGNIVGLIPSEQDLLDLIDKEQENIKNKFNVDRVYPPTGLDIEKIYTYNGNITDVNTLYNQIKEADPFSINGYIVTINYKQETDGEYKAPIKLYLLDSSLIKKALYKVAEAFIGVEELARYNDETQVEITDVGEVITSVYFEETITIKEGLISVEEEVFTDIDLLTQYILFGTTEEQAKYIVKDGEDLSTIAESHKLNISELLIANPEYPSGTALLVPGEVLNVGLINPLVNVVYRKTVVEDQAYKFDVEYIDDNTRYNDYYQTVTDGVDGTYRLTEDILYKNGVVNSVNITKQEVLKEPINKVVRRGTKKYTYYIGTAPPTGPSYDSFGWPTVVPYYITSKFEYRWGTHHNGIDISCGRNTPIYSSTSGTVIQVNRSCSNYRNDSCGSGFGNYVVVYSEDVGYEIRYGHMANNIPVSVGQTVDRGQVIGYMASSGYSTGVHLHFEINIPGTRNAVNPCKVAFRC